MLYFASTATAQITGSWLSHLGEMNGALALPRPAPFLLLLQLQTGKQSGGEFLAEEVWSDQRVSASAENDYYLFYHEVGDVHALRPVRQTLAGQTGLCSCKLVQDLVPDRTDQHVTAPVDVHIFQLWALDQEPF